MDNRWVRGSRLFPPGRTGRRRVRATAVTTLISLSLLLSTEQAMANGVSLPPLSMPKMSLSGVWEWLNTKPLDTPDQEGGTARGKSHKASADDTSAEGGVGRKPGKGKGELDPSSGPSTRSRRRRRARRPGTPTVSTPRPAGAMRRSPRRPRTSSSTPTVRPPSSTTPARPTSRPRTAPGSRSTPAWWRSPTGACPSGPTPWTWSSPATPPTSSWPRWTSATAALWRTRCGARRRPSRRSTSRGSSPTPRCCPTPTCGWCRWRRASRSCWSCTRRTRRTPGCSRWS